MDDTKPYVYQVADDELKRREVEVSLQNLTQVEITGGLFLSRLADSLAHRLAGISQMISRARSRTRITWF